MAGAICTLEYAGVKGTGSASSVACTLVVCQAGCMQPSGGANALNNYLAENDAAVALQRYKAEQKMKAIGKEGKIGPTTEKGGMASYLT